MSKQHGSLGNEPGSWSSTGSKDERILEFTPSSVGGAKDSLQIRCRSIVGLLETKRGEHSLIYVQRLKDLSNASDSPVHVLVETTTGLPSEIVQDYIINRSECVLFSSGSLSKAAKPEVSVISSIASGTRQASSYLEKALKPLLTACNIESDIAFHETTSEDTIIELARSTFGPKASQGTLQTIILLSGDGGIVDMANTILETVDPNRRVPPTIVALPLGSGNALSNSYKYNQDDTMGLSTLMCGKRQALPLFKATFSEGARLVVNQGKDEQKLSIVDGQPTMTGAVVCSWGLHSTLVADSDTEHYRQFGSARFGMVAKELMFPEDGSPSHRFKGRIHFTMNDKSENEPLDRDEHSYILATLVSNLEQAFCISPDSRSLDGHMRLVEMPHMPGDEMMKIMTAAYDSGNHIGMDKVGYHRIDSMQITIDEDDERWRRVCIDGKIVKIEKGGFVRVVKASEHLIDLVTLQ